ncbi:MAG: NAD-dependent epimerase/dehydratase family protein [Acidimicrobiia bacterium]|nr:NAD-dependent epimerase/dehydratase family protein [Acidimicrobiia bacterium]
MKVLILGGAGYLGPHVIKVLGPHHHLLVTDIKAPSGSLSHEFRRVDVSSLEQVVDAAKGMDAIINLSVLRHDRQIAFDVNARGCYNLMRAAMKHGIKRVINTGPHFTITGPPYEGFDFGLVPDVPSQSGTNLYALTKSLGHEICRVFTEHAEIYVQNYLFYNFRDTKELKAGSGGVPFIISWDDAGEIFRLGLEVELSKLPSRCEVFFVLGENPQGKFTNRKAKEILGFRPKDDLSVLWKRVS